MEQTKTQMELTIEELVALINSQKEDFLITVQYGEEAGDGRNSEERSG